MSYQLPLEMLEDPFQRQKLTSAANVISKTMGEWKDSKIIFKNIMGKICNCFNCLVETENNSASSPFFSVEKEKEESISWAAKAICGNPIRSFQNDICSNKIMNWKNNSTTYLWSPWCVWAWLVVFFFWQMFHYQTSNEMSERKVW